MTPSIVSSVGNPKINVLDIDLFQDSSKKKAFFADIHRVAGKGPVFVSFDIDSVDPDGKTMNNVMIFEQGKGTPFLDVTTARKATIENGLIVLQGAIQTRVLPNGTVQALTIAARDITVPLPLGDSGEKFLSQAYNDPYAMDAKRLSDQIAFRKLTGTVSAPTKNGVATFTKLILKTPGTYALKATNKKVSVTTDTFTATA